MHVRLHRVVVVACALPALDWQNVAGASDHQVERGFMALVFGWSLLFQLEPVWLANPVLLMGWIALRRSVEGYRAAAVAALACGAIALALGTSLLLFRLDTVPLGLDNPSKYRIDGLLVGCYVWWASILTVVTGALVAIVTRAIGGESAFPPTSSTAARPLYDSGGTHIATTVGDWLYDPSGIPVGQVLRREKIASDSHAGQTLGRVQVRSDAFARTEPRDFAHPRHIEQHPAGKDSLLQSVHGPELQPLGYDDIGGPPAVIDATVEEHVAKRIDVGHAEAMGRDLHRVMRACRFEVPDVEHAMDRGKGFCREATVFRSWPRLTTWPRRTSLAASTRFASSM
jgi:hypothetical protein